MTKTTRSAPLQEEEEHHLGHEARKATKNERKDYEEGVTS